MDGSVIEIRPTPWRDLMAELRAEGWTAYRIAQVLNLPHPTVQKWASGSVPNADAGFALVRLHRLVIQGRPIRAGWERR